METPLTPKSARMYSHYVFTQPGLNLDTDGTHWQSTNVSVGGSISTKSLIEVCWETACLNSLSWTIKEIHSSRIENNEH